MNDCAVWAPPRPRIFFMHLPKTAGMALRVFLGNQYPVDEVMPANDWPELLSVSQSDIERYKLFQGHFSCGLLELLPRDVKPVVFLREPVARTILHLKHMRRDPDFHPAHKLAAGRSLDDLVRDDHVMTLCCNVQASLLSNYIPSETILAGLRRDQREGRAPNPDAYAAAADLAAAENTLRRFHFIGLVEDLQNDILRLSWELGLHPPRPLPKRNFDPEGETDFAAIGLETLAIIRRWNAIDIALYDAVKRRPSRRPAVTHREVGSRLIWRGIYTPIKEPISFGMAGSMPGSNWYDCEEVQGGGHRWTGPLEETTLELPLAFGFDFEISMRALIPDLAEFSVHVGEFDLPIRRGWDDGRIQRISFWVPAELVEEGGLTTLRFKTERVFAATKPDIRLLSFMVGELSVSRVEPADHVKPAAPAPVESAPSADAAAVTIRPASRRSRRGPRSSRGVRAK